MSRSVFIRYKHLQVYTSLQDLWFIEKPLESYIPVYDMYRSQRVYYTDQVV